MVSFNVSFCEDFYIGTFPTLWPFDLTWPWGVITKNTQSKKKKPFYSNTTNVIWGRTILTISFSELLENKVHSNSVCPKVCKWTGEIAWTIALTARLSSVVIDLFFIWSWDSFGLMSYYGNFLHCLGSIDCDSLFSLQDKPNIYSSPVYLATILLSVVQ